jgi:hypothetical protein
VGLNVPILQKKIKPHWVGQWENSSHVLSDCISSAFALMQFSAILPIFFRKDG